MGKGFLIYEEMRKYFPIYEEAVSYIWLCNCSTLNFLIYEVILIFFFISVHTVHMYFVLLTHGHDGNAKEHWHRVRHRHQQEDDQGGDDVISLKIFFFNCFSWKKEAKSQSKGVEAKYRI